MTRHPFRFCNANFADLGSVKKKGWLFQEGGEEMGGGGQPWPRRRVWRRQASSTSTVCGRRSTPKLLSPSPAAPRGPPCLPARASRAPVDLNTPLHPGKSARAQMACPGHGPTWGVGKMALKWLYITPPFKSTDRCGMSHFACSPATKAWGCHMPPNGCLHKRGGETFLCFFIFFRGSCLGQR